MDARISSDLCAYDARPGVVADYLARRLPPGEEGAFERHYFACSRCWQELELALAVRAGGPAATRRAWRAPFAAVAAVATLAIGAGLLWWARPPRPEIPLLRGERAVLSVEVRRDAALRHLSWAAVDGATSYRVELFSRAGRAAREMEIQITAITLDLADAANAGVATARISARDSLRQTILASPSVELR